MRKLLIIICLIAAVPCMAVTGRVKLIDSPSGCKYLYAQVNGVRVRFLFDTGCSDIMITPRVWHELKRQGKVSDTDLAESSSSVMADGREQQGYSFVIKELKLGNFTFRNVRADVANTTDDADCLLGQSLLGQLEYYRVSGNTLEISVNETKNYNIADDSHSSPETVADALRPLYEAGQLNMTYRIRYAQALYDSKQYQDAVDAYAPLMDTTLYDVKPQIRDAWLYAQLGVANQLIEDEQYEQAIDYCLPRISSPELQKDSVGQKVIMGLTYNLFIAYIFTDNTALAAHYGLRYVDQKLRETHGITTKDLERRRIRCKDPMVANVLDNLRIAYYNKRDLKRSQYYEALMRNAGLR